MSAEYTDDQIRRYAKALKVKGNLRLARERYGEAEVHAMAQRLEDHLGRATGVLYGDDFYVIGWAEG